MENLKAKIKTTLTRHFDLPHLEIYTLYLFFFIALAGGIFLGYLVYSIETSKDIQELSQFRPSVPTTLYDLQGRPFAELFQHQRELISLKEIPNHVVAAFLAVEDTNFYKHFGLDFKGIVRALWQNIKNLRIVQGGSTITQQLVKGLYTKSEKTIFRKIYEAILALQVEKVYSKNEILEMYFNQTYFGHGAYGLATAARFYFNKPVQKLNLMEAAVLAALPKSPHTYSPFRNPHESREKNKLVLQRFVELGYLTEQQANELYNTFWQEYWKVVVTTPPYLTVFTEQRNLAPHFTEQVRHELIPIFGEETLYHGGYQIYTTLDLDHQQIAEEVMTKLIRRQDPIARSANRYYASAVDLKLYELYLNFRQILSLPSLTKMYSLRSDFRQKFKESNSDAFELITLYLGVPSANEVSENFLKATREFKFDLGVQGAFLAMEPLTGRISAMVGGREFKASDQFNRALQAKRQPGSAFKPFVYGAALEERVLHSAMGFLDSPLINVQPDGTLWAPSNYEGGYMGYVPAYRALSASLNIVSVQIYDLVGPEKIVEFASRLTKAPQERFQPSPALALGASELTPMELLLGLSVFANKGQDIIPHTIRYVTDRDGNIVLHIEQEVMENLNYKKQTGNLQLVEESVAFIMQQMLEHVVNGGTATKGVRVDGGYVGPAAGKTGTTSSHNDAWFVGFTSDLAAIVWLGMDQGSMTLGYGQSGGAICSPAWGEFMRRVYEKRGSLPKPFDEKAPEGVLKGGVCRYTYKTPNSDCDKELVGTLIPAPLKVNGQVKAVQSEKCDCNHVQSRSILDLAQEAHQITNEELGSTGQIRRRPIYQ
ncbi:MAG: PBP1A family penicillin-binding protein [Leptospiraceae bacterium]|nr:PBP1A family penicillin-binding protein [Leptospiraceae bacterium]MDW8305867.1 PBP1A family penicillin-binding protein [Leptospiraceae bacterium]